MVSVRKNNVIVKDNDGTQIVIENFHDVDWEQIYKLSIGAIQELDKRLNKIISDNLRLSNEIDIITQMELNNADSNNADIIEYIDTKLDDLNGKIENNILTICNEFYDNINTKIFSLENKLMKKLIKHSMAFKTDSDTDTDSPDSNGDSDNYFNNISKDIFNELVDMNKSYIQKQDEKINILGTQCEDLLQQNLIYREEIDKLNERLNQMEQTIISNRDKDNGFIKWISGIFFK